MISPSPTQALAAVCLRPSPAQDILVIEVEGQPAGAYVNLAEEDVGTCGPGTAMPLNGAARFGPDGKVHFGISTHSTTPSCAPFRIQRTLDPSSFTSGSGFAGNAMLVGVAVTFVPVACPGGSYEPDAQSQEGSPAIGRSLTLDPDLLLGRGGSPSDHPE